MKKIEIKEWIKALRSGDWHQNHDGHMKEKAKDSGNEYIEDKFRYCCLGVLAELSGGQWQPEVMLFDGEEDPHNFTYHPEGMDEHCLTDELRDAYGFYSCVGEFKDDFCYVSKSDQKYRNLAQMNDGGISFKEIADFIEANYDKVFKPDI